MSKRTALYAKHVALGAKITSFSGWEMPVYYTGILPEHRAVREATGVFDVSHMARIEVVGQGAEQLIERLSTNILVGKEPGSATYAVWCNEQGGAVDDLLVFKQEQDHFFVVVNAGNREKDLLHLQQHAKPEIHILPHFYDEGILAVQGPSAQALVARILPEVGSVVPHHFIQTLYKDKNLTISGTGYTGAGGVELFAAQDIIVDLWDRLLAEGAIPAGLGARDLLRLEMGYALYGHELTDEITPLESVAAWTVKWNKAEFIGREALDRQKKTGILRHAQGIQLLQKGIAREGAEVYKEGRKIGRVTSGNYSPTLDRGIALVLLECKFPEGEPLEVDIRGQRLKAETTHLPFIPEIKK